MKTKKVERTFYMNYEAFGCLQKGRYSHISAGLREEPNEIYNGKVTVSFDVPEKKVTISESEFDELCANDANIKHGFHPVSYEYIKQKLFGERNENE